MCEILNLSCLAVLKKKIQSALLVLAERLLDVREDDGHIVKTPPFLPGGFSGGKTLRDTHSYLPRLRRWVGSSPMAFARCDHGMAAVRDGIFCIGGRTLKGVSLFALVIPNLI